MPRNALFLQKPELLAQQQQVLVQLFQEFLPQYVPHFAGCAEEVAAEGDFPLIITSFLPFLPAVLQKVRKPEQLHFTGSGTDLLPQLQAQADLQGVRITASAGVNAVSIAEHVLGTMLIFAKNFHLYRDQQAQGIWKRYWHQEIRGQQVCILGMGHIGQEVAKRCRMLGMQVTGCVRTFRACSDTHRLISFADLPAYLPEFDYVVLALPLSSETEGLFGPSFLNKMKAGSVLINVARGRLIDQAALLQILQSGKGPLKGAALDVFEDEPLPQNHPFWEVPNLLITPHVAGTTQHYLRNMFEILAQQTQSGL